MDIPATFIADAQDEEKRAVADIADQVKEDAQQPSPRESNRSSRRQPTGEAREPRKEVSEIDRRRDRAHMLRDKNRTRTMRR